MSEAWLFVNNKMLHKATGFTVEFIDNPEIKEFQVFPRNFPARTSAVEVSRLLREATELYLSDKSLSKM